jgi:hypothetical protein
MQCTEHAPCNIQASVAMAYFGSGICSYNRTKNGSVCIVIGPAVKFFTTHKLNQELELVHLDTSATRIHICNQGILFC